MGYFSNEDIFLLSPFAISVRQESERLQESLNRGKFRNYSDTQFLAAAQEGIP